MSPSEFRSKHPKIFNQILERGAHAERIRVIYGRIKDKNPNDGTPFVYGERKHARLIIRELPLLA
jgi:hypothetical protein